MVVDFNLESMKITDLNGCAIKVTDLKEAIRIAKRYASYRHEDNNFSDFDKKQKSYWSDMHDKLIVLKEQATTIKIIKQ